MPWRRPPDGAAKRMTEATGYEASTIHRLLELSGLMEESSADVRFERNEDHPLEADVIIIDEMSMVDIYLMHALLSAIVPGTRLILVGDMNQLPSVGPGSVLRDMIHSEMFPGSGIDTYFPAGVGKRYRSQCPPDSCGLPVSLDNHSKDFFFLRRTEIPVIQKVVLTLVSQKLPRYVGARPAGYPGAVSHAERAAGRGKSEYYSAEVSESAVSGQGRAVRTVPRVFRVGG